MGGDGQAQSNLGHLLINGSGVLRDEAKAVRLFRQSAKIGTAEGELNYGLALLRGNGGLRVDYQEALEWAQKSVAQGHSLAQQQLPMFYNALKNPNPPARSVPTPAELSRLSVRDLRDLLRSEGVDFSDCVEKSDLMRRAAMQLQNIRCSSSLRRDRERNWRNNESSSSKLCSNSSSSCSRRQQLSQTGPRVPPVTPVLQTLKEQGALRQNPCQERHIQFRKRRHLPRLSRSLNLSIEAHMRLVFSASPAVSEAWPAVCFAVAYRPDFDVAFSHVSL